MPFDGETYERDKDKTRLKRQLSDVRRYLIANPSWHTLAELEEALKYPQASVSARIRDLRKPKFGGWDVQRRRREGAEKGTHEYYLVPGSKGSQTEPPRLGEEEFARRLMKIRRKAELAIVQTSPGSAVLPVLRSIVELTK